MELLKNFTKIPNELFEGKNLSLKAIGLYAYLKYKSFCGNGEITYPSQKRIMNDCNIGSDNTLRKVIQELKEHKFLLVKVGSTYTGNSIYKLLIPKKCDLDST